MKTKDGKISIEITKNSDNKFVLFFKDNSFIVSESDTFSSIDELLEFLDVNIRVSDLACYKK